MTGPDYYFLQAYLMTALFDLAQFLTITPTPSNAHLLLTNLTKCFEGCNLTTTISLLLPLLDLVPPFYDHQVVSSISLVT